MKRDKSLRYWPVVSMLAFFALIIVLVANSTPAQALNGDQVAALQGTPVVPTVVVPTVVVTNLPPVTVVAPTVVIPNTGGDTIIIDLFSNWALWALLGVFLIVLLIALVTRPGPTEPHHHHDV